VLYNKALATIFLGSPPLATPTFILARLYGRLVWRIGQAEINRPRRKRKRKAAPSRESAPI
jgi:hypothetical protein